MAGFDMQFGGDAPVSPAGGGGSPAPMPGAAPGGVQGQQLDKQTQDLLNRILTPRTSLRQPTEKYSEQSMTPGKFNMSTAKTKGQDVGISLQNAGVMLHNFAAEIKQRQVKQAYHDWQVLDDATTRAQEAVKMQGKDPSTPEGQQAMHAVLAETLKGSVLDPSDTKAQKRLKNMYKALNVDPFKPDQDNNASREGLKRLFQLKKAKQQVQNVQQQQQVYNQRIQSLMDRGMVHPVDPKQLEQVLSIRDREMAHRETMAYHQQQLAETLRVHMQQYMEWQQNTQRQEREFNERLAQQKVTEQDKQEHRLEQEKNMEFRQKMMEDMNWIKIYINAGK